MVVFFIVLTILFFLEILVLILSLSSLEIEIKKLVYDSERKDLEDYLIYIRIKLFNKITVVRIKIDNKRMKKVVNSKKFNSIFSKMDKKEIFKKYHLKNIKNLNIRIKEFNLYMELCTSNCIITSFGSALILSAISIILAKSIERYDRKKYMYIIKPKYAENPSAKIKLNCIIDLKIVHIMNIIYLNLKRRRENYDERASNRRAYASFNG